MNKRPDSSSSANGEAFFRRWMEAAAAAAEGTTTTIATNDQSPVVQYPISQQQQQQQQQDYTQKLPPLPAKKTKKKKRIDAAPFAAVANVADDPMDTQEVRMMEEAEEERMEEAAEVRTKETHQAMTVAFRHALDGIPSEMKPEYVQAKERIQRQQQQQQGNKKKDAGGGGGIARKEKIARATGSTSATCPIEDEMDPILFLRAVGFRTSEAWNAALKYCMYWKVRKEIYGERRYTFPMTKTALSSQQRSQSLDISSTGRSSNGGGDGSIGGICHSNSILKSEEIEMLETGYMTILPPDVEGSTVVYIDFGRFFDPNLPTTSSTTSSSNSGIIPPYLKKTWMLRHLFCLCHQAAILNPINQTRGIVFMFVFWDKDNNNSSKDTPTSSSSSSSPTVREMHLYCREPLEIIHKAIPVQIKKVYFVASSTLSKPIERAVRMLSLDSVIGKKGKKEHEGDDGGRGEDDGVAVTVSGKDPGEIASHLIHNKKGKMLFHLEGLPPEVGGTWAWDNIPRRQTERSIQNNLKPPPPIGIFDQANGSATANGTAKLFKSTTAIATPTAVTQTIMPQPSTGFLFAAAAAGLEAGGKAIPSLINRFTNRMSQQQQQHNHGEIASRGRMTTMTNALHIRMLSEAMKCIPDLESYYFFEANKRVPALVEHDSPFTRFLTSENNDALAAARRLSRYWRERKRAFGDRSLLPLNMSGQGALTHEDIATLLSGCISLLPNDRLGRPVICLDMTRICRPSGNSGSIFLPISASVLRIWFYCLQIASENVKAQSDGVSFLFILPKAADSMSILGGGGETFLSSLPVCVALVHVVILEQVTSWTGAVITLRIPNRLPLVGPVQANRVTVHAPSAGHNIVSRLSSYGLDRASLPMTIGGKWNDRDADLKAWIRSRAIVEREELSHLVMSHAESIYGVEPDSCAESEDEFIDESVNSKERYFSCINNGTDAFTETEEIMTKGLSALEDAISLLSFDDKSALLEAREKIPDLAEKEAPAIRFLRFENYNPWAAAERLARYWKNRKELFGDRAFLPMNLSGEGALTREDVVVFCSGYYVFLPYDKYGRSVVCFDQERMTDRSVDVRLRLAFYLFCVISENHKSQKEGVKLLIILRTTKTDKAAQTCSNMILECLPCRFESLHITNCPAESEQTTFSNTLAPIMLRVLGRLLKKKAMVHYAATKEYLVAELTKHDFLPQGLPECLGGSWSYEGFNHWVELRTRYEWDLPPVGGGKDPMKPHIPEYKVKARSQLTEAEKIERKRRLNVLNSRRKRDRVRVEVAVFHDQVDQLRKNNRRLQIENKRLEEFIVAANAEVERAKSTGPSEGSSSSHSPTVNSNSSDISPPQPGRKVTQEAGAGSRENGVDLSIRRGEEFSLQQQQQRQQQQQQQQQPTVTINIHGSVQQQLLQELLRDRTINLSLNEQLLAGGIVPGLIPPVHQQLQGNIGTSRVGQTLPGLGSQDSQNPFSQPRNQRASNNQSNLAGSRTDQLSGLKRGRTHRP